MNTALALKIEEALGLEEGYFMLLQLYHDIKQEKLRKKNLKPDLALFRKVLFWDTELDKIDWQRQYKAIIRRVFERGNEREKEETTRFYGIKKITHVLASTPSK